MKKTLAAIALATTMNVNAEPLELPGTESIYPNWITILTPNNYDNFVSEGNVAVLNCKDNCDELINRFAPYADACRGLKVGLVNQNRYPINYTNTIQGDDEILYFGDNPENPADRRFTININADLSPTSYSVHHCGYQFDGNGQIINPRDPSTIQGPVQSLSKAMELLSVAPSESAVFKKLVDRGLSEEFLTDLKPQYYQETLAAIQSGQYSLELFDEYELYGEDYSARAAGKSPFYTGKWSDVDKPALRNHIQKKLDANEHLRRNSTDYIESSEQIQNINDPIILLLVEQYIEYFNSDASKKELAPILTCGGPERGGFLKDNDGISFVEIPNTSDETGLYSEGRVALQYLHRLGSFHTHPVQEEFVPTQYSGPSGWAKYYDGKTYGDSDTTMLRAYTGWHNNFFIDSVVSEIDCKTYNVDIYFRDVVWKDGKRKNTEDITVLDIGVYKK